jgi:hypothetical protein
VNFTVRVHGLRELQSALKKADGGLDKMLKAELKKAGDLVKGDATGKGSRYSGIGPYRTAVRSRGVAVEQSKGKVTGLRGDFGALQMRNVLEPSLQENEAEARRIVEHGLERLISSAGL